MATTTMPYAAADSETRIKEVKQFDETKAGVKGLVDAGVTTIPSFFINPPETLSTLKSSFIGAEIPTIDFSGIDSPDRRSSVLDQIKRASSTVGFFQVINHGIPLEVFDRAIAAARAFHEMPGELKAPLYRRDLKGVSMFSNQDLHHAKSAYWRDTMIIQFAPKPADPKDIPEVCRDPLLEFHREVCPVAELLLDFLNEGLGLDTGRLKELTLCGSQTMLVNYYPFCPQPDLTVGFRSHCDPGTFTIVLQDHVGGLQAKYEEGWVDLKPVPGALVVNIADLLQIMSNEEYKSVDHRVLANPHKEPRVSIGLFFNPSADDKVYGPLPELTSAEKPAIYNDFIYKDYLFKYFHKEVDNRSQKSIYRK